MLDRKDIFDLSGKTALVTGASSGLGVTLASALLANGASVVICARREGILKSVARDLDPSGERVLALTCDVADPSQVTLMAGRSIERFGRIDVLVNNAGIDAEGSPFPERIRRRRLRRDGRPRVGPLLQVTRMAGRSIERFGRIDVLVNNAGIDAEGSPFPERIADGDFAETVRVNLLGVWHCTRILGTEMIADGGGGSIINISSIGGLGGSKAMMSPGYSAAKAGVINLTQNIAANWADRGIRVNCIAPGYFPSELSEFVRTNPPVTEHVRAQVPIGRFGEPSELAGVLLLLASSAGSYITGQTVNVDGGFSATVGARTPSDELYAAWGNWLPDDKGTPLGRRRGDQRLREMS